MKIKFRYFLLLTFIYAVLFSMKKAGVYFCFISDYLADLICIPWSLLAAALIMNRIPAMNFKFNGMAVFVAVIYFSVVFELFMPFLSKSYTADWADVFCYITGGLIYFIFLREKEISKAF